MLSEPNYSEFKTAVRQQERGREALARIAARLKEEEEAKSARV